MNAVHKRVLGGITFATLFVLLSYMPNFVERSYYKWVTDFDDHIIEKAIFYQDVCVGETKQEIVYARDVVPPQGFYGEVRGELFIKDDEIWKETAIRRVAKDVFWQPNNGEEFSFFIEWDKPLTEVGTYSEGSFTEIYVLQGINKTKYQPAGERTFKVIECND